MIVDHIGAFFLVEDVWLRAIGRLSAPIWLFLVGYARSRDFSDRMWIGIALLAGVGYLTGGSPLPISILGTMLLCRMGIDPLMNMLRRNPAALYPFSLILFFGTFVTTQFIEYGTVAMLVVMLGYMTRNRDTLPFTRSQYLQYTAVVSLAYFLIQMYLFQNFDTAKSLFVGGGLLAVLFGLSFFQPVVYPELTRKTPRPFVWLVQIGGRYSLEFYVAHLLLFKAIVAFSSTGFRGFS